MNRITFIILTLSIFSSLSHAVQASDVEAVEAFFRARTGASMNVCVYGRSLAKTLAQGSQLSILEIDDSKSNIKRVNVRGYTN